MRGATLGVMVSECISVTPASWNKDFQLAVMVTSGRLPLADHIPALQFLCPLLILLNFVNFVLFHLAFDCSIVLNNPLNSISAVYLGHRVTYQWPLP